MSRWFRMYDEVLDDPKAQRLSGDLFKKWVNLLCLASRNDGSLPSTPEVAFALRIGEDDAGKAVSDLVNAGLIDGTSKGYVMHNWRRRQYKSDVSTSRVKRFRNGDETEKIKNRNVSASVSVSVSDSVSASESGKEDAPFEAFWKAYPRKQGRGQAVKEFKAAILKTDLPTMLAAIERYKTTKPTYQDYAMPATWLNGERWLDVPHEAPTVKKYGDPQPTTGAAPGFDPWQQRLDGFKERGLWLSSWGPKPGELDCEAPKKLVDEALLNVPPQFQRGVA